MCIVSAKYNFLQMKKY